jgi:hypothetical protein
MTCSKCGRDGHNARTCSAANSELSDRDHALWIKFDNIKEEETNNILKDVMDSKTKRAPEARATFARGKKNELPGKIRKALGMGDDDGQGDDDDA